MRTENHVVVGLLKSNVNITPSVNKCELQSLCLGSKIITHLPVRKRKIQFKNA